MKIKDNDKFKRKHKRKSGNKGKRLAAMLLIAALLLTGYAHFIEPHILTHTEDVLYRDTVENQKSVRIAVFGDTHFSDYYTKKDFDKVVSAINGAEPDIVIFVGDLIDNYADYDKSVDDIIEGLSSIQAKIGKYAVYGNHDYGGGMQFEFPDIMEAGGFDLLVNEYVAIDDRKIGIMGLDDVLIGFGEPEYASLLRPDYYNLLICHEPDMIDNMLDYNVDLMVSGHTHGRQINLPFFDRLILPTYGEKYIRGLFQFENERKSKLFVTVGLGTTKIPMRFAAVPEINIIDII